VTTAFPRGATKDGAVDVRYEAEPGGGAEITRVAYSINGGPWEYVYLRGGDGASPKGALGAGRVMLAPGENNIVFRATDSAGRTATYAVPETPVFDFGSTPDRAAATLAPSAAGGGAQYVTDQIVAIARRGATDAQVAQAALSVGGTIAAQVNPVGMYCLKVPGGTEAGLKALCDRLLADHPGVFAAASLDRLRFMGAPAPGADAAGSLPSTAQTNDPWWGYSEWGLTAMNVPDAWAEYAGRLYDTKVGVVDDGFRITHDDLQLPTDNVYNRNKADKYHGSHVMGTIGAVHNNAKGLTGVMDADRASLYGYDCFATWNGAYDSDIIAGLGWVVSHGAKAVKFSLGADGGWHYDPEEDALYSNAMQNLLDQGHDFVVVHAAGNDAINAFYSACFAFISDPELRQRIITVGAMELGYSGGYQLAYFTNWGPLVDVVAPGVDIYSSTAGSNSSYAYYDGTSMAAPHITGLAGLVYSVNPGLTGDLVKTFIVDAAHESGAAILDTRTSVPAGERRTYYLANARAAVATVLDQVSVTVEPKAFTQTAGATKTFTATVTGATTGNTAVTWQATGGSITQGGAYTAPATTGTYTVTATSQADASKSDTATVAAGIAVSVSPKTATLVTGGTRTFTATVTGGTTGNTDVTWAATGGSITTGGAYTAPATTGTYTVTATSVADTSKKDTATVTVVDQVSVTIEPKVFTQTAGATKTFVATVTGGVTGDTTVTWSVTGGSITQGGAYTAPATPGMYTITATSQEDPSKSDTATVTVVPPTVAVTPKTAILFTGDAQTFAASVSFLGDACDTTVTWGATGGAITTSGLYPAPQAPGAYTITATSNADGTTGDTAAVTVYAPIAVAVSPKAATLTTGDMQTFSVTVTGGMGDTTVTWAASGGAITQGGAYTAPATTGTYTVTATSHEDPSKSDAATVTVVAPIVVSVSPKATTLAAGGTWVFAATVTGGTGNTAVVWTATGGAITQGGLYIAPATPGTYTVTATSQEDPSKSDSATVTVASLTMTGSTMGLFVGGTAQFAASVVGLTDGSVA
jgi:subtilisin family serine protease